MSSSPRVACASWAAVASAPFTHARLRPAAEDEVQRIDEDALPGARLSGKHVEPWREMRLELVDDGERADAQQLQHAGSLAKPPDIAGRRVRRSATLRPAFDRAQPHPPDECAARTNDRPVRG